MKRRALLALALTTLFFGGPVSEAADAFISGSWTGTLLGGSSMEEVELQLSVRGDQVRGHFVWLDRVGMVVAGNRAPTRRTFRVTRGVKKEDMWIVGFEGQVSKKRITAGFTQGKTRDQLNGILEGWQNEKGRVMLLLQRVKPLSTLARGLVGTWRGSGVQKIGLGPQATVMTDGLTLEIQLENGRLHGRMETRRSKGEPTSATIDRIDVQGRKVTFQFPAPLGNPYKYTLTLQPGGGVLSGSSVGGILNTLETIKLEKGRKDDVEPSISTPGSPLGRPGTIPFLTRTKKEDPPKPISPEQRAKLISDLTEHPWRGYVTWSRRGLDHRTTRDMRVFDLTFRAEGDALASTLRETRVDPKSPADAPAVIVAEHAAAVRLHGPRAVRFTVDWASFELDIDAQGRVLKGLAQKRTGPGAAYLPVVKAGVTLEKGLDLPLHPTLEVSEPIDYSKFKLPDWRKGLGGRPAGVPKPPKAWQPRPEKRPDAKYLRGVAVEADAVRPLVGTWVGSLWRQHGGRRHDIPVDLVFAYEEGELLGSLIQPGVLSWQFEDDWLSLRLESAEGGKFRFVARDVLPWKIGDPVHDVELHVDERGVLRGTIAGWRPTKPGEPGYQFELTPATAAPADEKALLGTWRGRVPRSVYEHQDYILRFELRRGRLVGYVPLQTGPLDLYASTPIRSLKVAGSEIGFEIPAAISLIGMPTSPQGRFRVKLTDGVLAGTVERLGREHPVEFKRE